MTSGPAPRLHVARRVLRLPVLLKRAVAAALAHDFLNVSQSAAYSAIVALFPGLVVAGALFALLPFTATLRGQAGDFFYQVLPDDVSPLLTAYFAPNPGSARTLRALVLAGVVSLFGASSVIATLMEGLRRAQDLPLDCWTFWQRRVRALVLVPLSLIPSLAATALVVFGHFLTTWLSANLFASIRPGFMVLSAGLRWIVALTGVAGLTAVIYHLGTPAKQHWKRTLPGAAMATLLWFASTLLFGLYVTRYANYREVYGSLGAGIALLFWLYLVFLSVLVGAEFNAQMEKAERR